MVQSHKSITRNNWLNIGLIITSKEEFEEIYDNAEGVMWAD